MLLRSVTFIISCTIHRYDLNQKSHIEKLTKITYLMIQDKAFCYRFTYHIYDQFSLIDYHNEFCHPTRILHNKNFSSIL